MNPISLLPALLMLGGAYFTVYLGGFHILRPRKIFITVRDELKKKSAVSSLMLALAGTLGVGNITGVAVGISIGGAGAVLWLLVSCLFSSVIK